VLLVGLVGAIGVAASSLAPAARAAGPPEFEPGPCPQTPFPVPELKNARCGFLVVPENRAKPDGRTIRLAVAIVPAASPRPAPDPVAYMSGGPGYAAILQAEVAVDIGLNRNRDLILMDQRATALNKPALTCPEYDRARAHPELPYDSASSERRQVAAVGACRSRLAAKGLDLGAYNTTENAADFADLRRALGIPQWNVYAFSYGTDLALTYMREHPQGIRSVTIDSVMTPHLASVGRAWTSYREAFDNVLRACEAQRRCRERYPRLGRTFASLVRKLESDPLRTRAKPAEDVPPVKVALDGGALVNWLVGAFDHDAANIPAAIDKLARGRPGRVAEGRAAVALTEPGLFGEGLTFGVFCGEWLPYEGPDNVLRQGRRAFPTYPTSVLASAPQYPFMTKVCRTWDIPKAPASVRAVTRSNIPTLVLSGTFDAATGESLAKSAAETLPNSTFVSVPGVGHGVAFASPCARDVLGSFLATPSAPDTDCVAGLEQPRFAVRPWAPRRYRGRTSQGKGIRFEVSRLGTRVKGVRSALRVHCPDGTFRARVRKARTDVKVRRGRRFSATERIAFRGRQILRLRGRLIQRPLVRPHSIAKGTLRIKVRGPGGKCRSGKVRWKARGRG
jgi:pimeloyl-ACP methyl ester carboxylesterase